MSMPGRSGVGAARPTTGGSDRIVWTDAEKQRVIAEGLRIIRDGKTKNLTSVMQSAQGILPSPRKRNIQTVYGPTFNWFTEPLKAEMDRIERGAEGEAETEEAAGEPEMNGSAAASDPRIEVEAAAPAPAGEITMEQLMGVDPRMLLRALENHCLTRLDAFAGMLLDMESMFARMSAMRTLDPLAASRLEPRSARDTPNLRRLVHAPRQLATAAFGDRDEE